MNYRPGDNSSQTIIPKEDNYNKTLCQEKFIKHYTRLIIMSNDSKENQKYMNKISEILFPTDSSSSLLETAEHINNRMKNVLYNTLANSLLKMEEKQIEYQPLIKKIKAYFNLNEEDNLKIIEHIFEEAMQQSKNTEFTKADSYDGLIRIYKKQIKEQGLDNKKLTELQAKIESMTKKMDEINKQLKRSGWQLGQSRL